MPRKQPREYDGTILSQIVPATGIDADHWSQWNCKLLAYQLDGVEGVVESFRKYPIRPYCANGNDVTRENNFAVETLDTFGELANEEFSQNGFDKSRLLKMAGFVHFLVYNQGIEIGPEFRKRLEQGGNNDC